jgi:type II secretory pathway pseudopilin PulG
MRALRRLIPGIRGSTSLKKRAGNLSPLPQMTKTKAVILAAVAALGVAGFFLQRQFDARLQAQEERLRLEAEENERLAAENARLAKAAVSAGPSGPAEAAAAAPARPTAPGSAARQGALLAPGMTPVETLGNAGTGHGTQRVRDPALGRKDRRRRA